MRLVSSCVQGVHKPFTEVIKANIGDAHAMGQKPITFIRQVTSLVTYPELVDSNRFPQDVKSRARDILKASAGSIGTCNNTYTAYFTYTFNVKLTLIASSIDTFHLLFDKNKGCYSDSVGMELVRQHTAKYIEQRDGGFPSDPSDIVLCSGATEGIRVVYNLRNLFSYFTNSLK